MNRRMAVMAVIAAGMLAWCGCGSGAVDPPPDDDAGRPKTSPLAAGAYSGTSQCTSVFEDEVAGASDPQMLSVELTVSIGPAGLPVEGDHEVRPGDTTADDSDGVATTTTVMAVRADESGVTVEKSRSLAVNEGTDSARHLAGTVVETYAPASGGAIRYTLEWTLESTNDEPFLRWTNQCQATLTPAD